MVKQLPIGYFRTFTYQALPFNPAVAQQLFSYPTISAPAPPPSASKLINPLQYLVPSKSYTQLAATNSATPSSPYTGPLQAQQSVQQASLETSPPAVSSAQSPVGHSAPIASIAESLTSDERLPVASVPMPLQSQPSLPQQQQQQQPQQPQMPLQQQQQQPHPQSQPMFQQQYTVVPPVPAVSPIQYSAGQNTPRLLSATPASYLASNLNEYQQQQMYQQQAYNVPYMMGGGQPAMQMPVQFVPCMCPVSYAIAAAQADKRSDDELLAPTTVTDYHQVLDASMLGAGGALTPQEVAESKAAEMANVGA